MKKKKQKYSDLQKKKIIFGQLILSIACLHTICGTWNFFLNLSRLYETMKCKCFEMGKMLDESMTNDKTHEISKLFAQKTKLKSSYYFPGCVFICTNLSTWPQRLMVNKENFKRIVHSNPPRTFFFFLKKIMIEDRDIKFKRYLNKKQK